MDSYYIMDGELSILYIDLNSYVPSKIDNIYKHHRIGINRSYEEKLNLGENSLIRQEYEPIFGLKTDHSTVAIICTQKSSGSFIGFPIEKIFNGDFQNINQCTLSQAITNGRENKWFNGWEEVRQYIRNCLKDDR